MNVDENPYIMGEDYLRQYKESAEKLREDKNVIDFEKLCYKVFTTDDGQKLLSYITDNFLLSPTRGAFGQGFADACIYNEGMRQAYRLFIISINSFKERMKADINASLL